MTSSEFKSFVERIKTCLRNKRERKVGAKCTLNEVFSTFSQDEKRAYHYYKLPNFLNSFAESIKNNPKIEFDIQRQMFGFKHKFSSPEDLIHKLYSTRVGVIEDNDLYDDIDKEELMALKNAGFLREIVIKERKTKAPLILLYSRNHTDDDVEKLKLEEKTPVSLKNYWASIDHQEMELKKKSKHSNITYLNKGQNKASKKKKRRRFREEDNLWLWKNNHLIAKVERSLKEIESQKGTVNKPKKKIKKK